MIGLFGTLSYAGELVGHIIHPYFSDRYGRKNFILLGAAYQLFVYWFILASNNYKHYFIVLPLFGMGVQIGQFISYVHLMEYMKPSKIPILTSILFFIEGICGYIISPILLMIFKQANSLVVTAVILNIASLSLFAYCRPNEGIKYLLSVEKFEKAKREI